MYDPTNDSRNSVYIQISKPEVSRLKRELKRERHAPFTAALSTVWMNGQRCGWADAEKVG